MSRTRYTIGISGRGFAQDEPLLHASTGTYRTKTGHTFLAVCGAGVWHVRRYADERFDPEHPRACPKCRDKAAA